MKNIRILLLLVVTAALIASCKSHEKCPAYSKAKNTQSTIQTA